MSKIWPQIPPGSRPLIPSKKLKFRRRYLSRAGQSATWRSSLPRKRGDQSQPPVQASPKNGAQAAGSGRAGRGNMIRLRVPAPFPTSPLPLPARTGSIFPSSQLGREEEKGNYSTSCLGKILLCLLHGAAPQEQERPPSSSPWTFWSIRGNLLRWHVHACHPTPPAPSSDVPATPLPLNTICMSLPSRPNSP